MVSAKTNKRKAVDKSNKLALIGLIVAILSCGIVFAMWSFLGSKASNDTNGTDIAKTENIPAEPVLPESINFQPEIDEWVSSLDGNKSVFIYDLERGEVAGSYQSKEDYSTASIYKLFVVYEGYRRVQSGEWDANDSAGYTGYSILECLDLAIRQSHSPCAETLWGMIGRENLDAIVNNDFGITNSNISSFDSNPEDVAKMLKIFYEHKEITDDVLLSRMKDSFLNQPKTEYDWWRQGLPSGFSQANVYNKVGWEYNPDGQYWNIYHDAAIVEFPEQNRHFIIVVMTNRVPYQKIAELGSMIETKYYQEQSN